MRARIDSSGLSTELVLTPDNSEERIIMERVLFAGPIRLISVNANEFKFSLKATTLQKNQYREDPPLSTLGSPEFSPTEFGYPDNPTGQTPDGSQ